MAYRGRSIAERIRDAVEPDAGGCWRWRLHKDRDGYAKLTLNVGGVGRPEMAHRLAYLAWVGNIPTGMEIDHLCRVRDCVNPAHLEAVTRQVNCQRRTNDVGIIAERRARTHCPRGHPYDEANTYRAPKTGYRNCRTCIKTGYGRRSAAAVPS